MVRGFVLRLLVRAVALLPWAWLRAFAVPVAWVVGSVLRVRRTHVERSMRRAGVADPAHVARSMYESLARSLFEFLWMAGRPQTALEGLIRVPPLPEGVVIRGVVAGAPDMHGDSSAASKCGVILVTAHTGNWDLVACAVAERLVPGLVVVTKRLHASWLDRVWQNVRERRGLCLVSSRDLVRTLSEVLRAGRSVAIVIDQVPESRKCVDALPFAGAPALYDRLPATLSMRTGAPIVMALGRRGTDGLHHIEVPLAMWPPAKASRAWMSHAMASMNECLDAFVRRYPEQWLWLHRRWKGVVGRRPNAAGV